MRQCLLAVDAGNSKTVAMVLDDQGRVLGRGRAGNGDIYGAATAELAVQAVQHAVRAALISAEVSEDQVVQAAFRLAGADWEDDKAFLRQAVRDRMPGLRSFSIENDGLALLRCGNPEGVGVAVTAGTGPAVAARGHEALWCASWWIQHELGGGGLGRAGFRAVVDAGAGIAAPTALTEVYLAHFGCSDVEALLYAFTRRGQARSGHELASIARGVLQTATSGDVAALDIVRRQTEVLARLATAAARHAGLIELGRPIPVILGGSVLTSDLSIYRDHLSAVLHQVLEVDIVPVTAAPIVGAALDAYAEAGWTLSEIQRTRLLTDTHPVDFLTT